MAVDALVRLPGVRLHEPDGAFYVFADFRQHGDDAFELAMRLRDEQRVITAPGEAFGPDGAGWLRISFCAEPDVIREGIERIARGLGAP